jgi:hypothetical protein
LAGAAALNFIEAVRTRDESILNGPPETGHLAPALAQLRRTSPVP